MNLKNIKPDIRYLKDMKDVIYDKEWLKTAPEDLELYYMYRGIKKQNNLRYDITVIPPRMLGQEFVKTKGHHHISENKELYIVLEGEAIFLIQKNNKEKIEDVFAVRAKKGDSIIVPLNCGHITINPINKELKLANWIDEKCENDYGLFQKLEGACYFYIKKPITGKVTWIKNENYTDISEIRFEQPLKEIPKDLEFLK